MEYWESGYLDLLKLGKFIMALCERSKGGPLSVWVFFGPLSIGPYISNWGPGVWENWGALSRCPGFFDRPPLFGATFSHILKIRGEREGGSPPLLQFWGNHQQRGGGAPPHRGKKVLPNREQYC